MNENKEYIPTTAEKKLFEVFSDPENYTIPINALCNKADVARNTYYEACKKPGFIEMKNKILDKVFESLVPEVKKAAMKYAITNAKNFQDRKMILEMTGEYKPQQDININAGVEKSALEKELEELEKANKGIKHNG